MVKKEKFLTINDFIKYWIGQMTNIEKHTVQVGQEIIQDEACWLECTIKLSAESCKEKGLSYEEFKDKIMNMVLECAQIWEEKE